MKRFGGRDLQTLYVLISRSFHDFSNQLESSFATIKHGIFLEKPVFALIRKIMVVLDESTENFIVNVPEKEVVDLKQRVSID